MPKHSRATVKVVPQHVPSHAGQIHVEIDYDTPDREDPPNDYHLRYRKLSPFNGKWLPLDDKNIDPHQAWPIHKHYDKPAEPGTYDIRVSFTMNGVELPDGERTGQFFVD